jgi:hypothetical protein
MLDLALPATRGITQGSAIGNYEDVISFADLEVTQYDPFEEHRVERVREE